MSKAKTTSASAPRIVIDTREQRPYEFDDSILSALPAGDYSVEGYEARVAVERKSLDDWIGTVLRDRDRFARELARLHDYSFAAVVIEGSWEDVAERRYRSDVSPAALFGLTTELMIRLRPVLVVMGGSRPTARVVTERLLRFAVKVCREADELQAAAAEVTA